MVDKEFLIPRQERNYMDQNVIEPILKYGEGIINSDIFQSGYHQKHHLIMTVSDHSMDVTIMSLKISRFLKHFGVTVDEKDLVEGALCHDLGILGRYEKFKNSRQCCRMHPVLSVDEAKKLIPDIDQKTEQIIRRHMWPATAPSLPPNSKEGFIVMLADKYSAMREFISIFVGPEFKKDVRTAIQKEASPEGSAA